MDEYQADGYFLVYKDGSYLKAINEAGEKILSVYGAKDYVIYGELLYYKDGSYLKAIDQNGQEVISEYGGELP